MRASAQDLTSALAAAIGAKAFYATVFGWSFQDFGEFSGSTYWGVVTGPEDKSGINGGLVKGPPARPAEGQGTNAFACTVGIDDYDEIERRILDAGGQVALPKMALTGMAWQCYYLDRRRLRPMPNLPLALVAITLAWARGLSGFSTRRAPKLRFCQFGRNNHADRRSRGARC